MQVATELGQGLVSLDGQICKHHRAGTILLEEVLEAVALGGCVLGMRAHVQVQAPAVTQEKVRRTPLMQERLKQLASGVLGIHRCAPTRGRGREPVLRFDAENPAPHVTGHPAG